MNRKNIIAVRFLTALLFISSCLVATTLAQSALEKAPPLPAGMTGSNSKDPRSSLSPGLFDAGETAFGMKHLQLLKKPDAFQLGIDPDGTFPRNGDESVRLTPKIGGSIKSGGRLQEIM